MSANYRFSFAKFKIYELPEFSESVILLEMSPLFRNIVRYL